MAREMPAWIRGLDDDDGMPAWLRDGKPRGVDPEAMLVRLAEGIASIEAAREERETRNAAARQRARYQYEQVREQLLGERQPVRVAAWAWAEAPPVRVW